MDFAHGYGCMPYLHTEETGPRVAHMKMEGPVSCHVKSADAIVVVPPKKTPQDQGGICS